MKKLIKLGIVCLCCALALTAFAACWDIDISGMTIMAISREDASGTRTAFDDMVRNAEGQRLRDLDGTPGTRILQGTGGVLGAVAANPSSIGYVSLGSVNNTVRTIPINSLMPNQAGFPLARDFNIGTAAGVTLNYSTQNFVSFLQSTDAQVVIEDRGFVRLDNISIAGVTDQGARAAYVPMTQNHTGSPILIRGSTSVEPVMNHLITAFLAHNTGRITLEAGFNISAQGTSHGTSSITDSNVNPSANWDRTISMRSSPENNTNVTQFDICIDIIAVIVHPDNNIAGLTLGQLYDIYAGTATVWRDVI